MSDSLFSVAGQVVIVSGGSRGIGRAIAQGFADRGAQVVITGRQKETLDEVAQELSSDEGTVRAVVCDVSDSEQIKGLVQTVVTEFGQIDCLINVAGVNQRQRAEAYTPDQYDFIMDINLRGAFLLSQAVGRHMLERGSGTQINVDSLNTYAPLKGVVPYATSKFGMVGMTRGLAAEWGDRGVRVNTLAPGFTLTALTENMLTQPKIATWVKANTPLQRVGQVEDMLGAAIFLASNASAFITGQVIRVDGGVSAGLMWPIDL
jgi:gluconate 5-dehydrogenase